MSTKMFALLLGGVIPAFLLGFAAIFQKLAGQHQLGTGFFLVITGLTTTLIGGICLAVDQDRSITPSGVGMAFLFGLFWAVSSWMITLSMRKYGASISQLAPLFNMNTLIAVLAGLVLLAEWKSVSPPRILLCAFFIIVGGLLAAKS